MKQICVGLLPWPSLHKFYLNELVTPFDVNILDTWFLHRTFCTHVFPLSFSHFHSFIFISLKSNRISFSRAPGSFCHLALFLLFHSTACHQVVSLFSPFLSLTRSLFSLPLPLSICVFFYSLSICISVFSFR